MPLPERAAMRFSVVLFLLALFACTLAGFPANDLPFVPVSFAQDGQHRIIRLHLKKDSRAVERLEVLEANNPLFDEPTLGVLVRDSFYYIANSQWGSVDEKGQLAPPEKLREPVILKVKL
jgi:hypothetical protein